MSNTPDNNRLEPDRSNPAPLPPLQVEILLDDGVDCPLELGQLRQAATAAAEYRGCPRGQLGIRVSDDAHIHQINRQHLGHDYPTDVISFPYAMEPPSVEGELVVSAETARREAERLGWSPAAELTLYVVHGTLHLTGMDDRRDDQRAEMRRAEQDVLQRLGIDGLDRFGADAALERRGDETAGDETLSLGTTGPAALDSGGRISGEDLA